MIRTYKLGQHRFLSHALDALRRAGFKCQGNEAPGFLDIEVPDSDSEKLELLADELRLCQCENRTHRVGVQPEITEVTENDQIDALFASGVIDRKRAAQEALYGWPYPNEEWPWPIPRDEVNAIIKAHDMYVDVIDALFTGFALSFDMTSLSDEEVIKEYRDVLSHYCQRVEEWRASRA